MTKVIKLTFLLSLLLLLSHGTNAKASEVTGNLSTGIGGTIGNTIVGTVVTPTPPVQSGGGGGGGGGSTHTSSISKSGGGTSSPKGTVSNPAVPTVSLSALPAGQVLGASVYHFATDLTIGSQGSDVVALQNALIAGGYLVGQAPTGYFGALTKAAVTKYQSAHGITSTGYVGPLTRNALTGAIAPEQQDRASLIASLIAQIQALEAQLAASQGTTTTSR